ncbi:MAG TPA: hypothetical protein PKN21_05470, partial [Bacteroidales bacterium]|nr:hypothetical protein [Bacteroidales bacterium]
LYPGILKARQGLKVFRDFLSVCISTGINVERVSLLIKQCGCERQTGIADINPGLGRSHKENAWCNGVVA